MALPRVPVVYKHGATIYHQRQHGKIRAHTMNAIRWNIRDRKTGQSMILPGPVNQEQCDQLSLLIKNCSSVGISEQGRYNASTGR